jgi:hypothetical protein
LEILDASKEDIDPLKIAVRVGLNTKTPQQVEQVRRQLIDDDPEIWTETKGNSLIINITSFRGLMMFKEEDKKIVADRIGKILRAENSPHLD